MRDDLSNKIEEITAKLCTEKQAAQNQAQAQQQASAGAACEVGGKIDQYYRPSLRDRIGKRLSGSMEEVKRADKLTRLCNLLDKNPDVAEILDLFEQVG